MRSKILAFAVAAAVFVSGSSMPCAQQSKPLTPEQEARIKELVKEYILANPELILEAVQTLRRRQEETASKQARESLKANREQVLQSKDLPVAGNPNGTVTIVEFFDYRCGYCKGVKPTLEQVLKSDGRIRLVYREFPILGPASRVASMAAIASHKQGRYLAFHNALMAHTSNLSEEAIYALAKQVGLDVAKLKDDMLDPAIRDHLDRNHKLAEQLGIRGTPAFVIGDEIVPGAVGIEEFQQRIAAAREACKTEQRAIC